MSALFMAIYMRGMSKRETSDLTRAMIDTGEIVDLSFIKGAKVDKHSTGGVGDKTTLVLGPMIAACGLPFAKMSGRGLGHTGGTLDKLDSIRGFNTELSKEDFIRIINKTNICICSQSANIAPADKKFYALRDVTATVDNMSLIASSVMSKKLSLQSDAIVLDVKVGNGAFMKDLDSAFELSKQMVDIGESFGRKTVCMVTDMNEPLGYAVGNALEVKEAIDTLKNKGPSDLVELSLELGSMLLLLGNKVKSIDEGKDMLKEVISNGKAFDKLKELVESQGGDISYIEDTSKFSSSSHIVELISDEDGYIKEIIAEEVGKCALGIGAGRETKDSKIDLSAGIVLNKKVDDKVSKGDILAYIHGNDLDKIESIASRLKDSFKIGEKNKQNKKLIYGIVENNNIITY